MNNTSPLRLQKGLTLVESLVSITILTIIAISIYSLLALLINFVAGVKARDAALSIAQQRLEIIRNLPFNDIATQYGWSPAGALLNSETITKNNINFTVETSVAYVNDPFDGTNGASTPPDVWPFDYKKAEVSVSWNKFPGQPVVLTTIIVPKGVEGKDATKGGLWIKVFNASGTPLNAGQINVTNSSNNYSLTTFTDSNGNLFVTDLSPNSNYKVVATKAGMSTDQTLSNTELVSMGYAQAQSSKPHLGVLAGKITESSFTIDTLSSFSITTENKPANNNVKLNSTIDNAENPSLITDSDNNSFVIWNTADNPQRLYAQKVNQNLTPQWTNPINITTSNNQVQPFITERGSSFYVVWSDDKNGNNDIYFNKFSKSTGASELSGSKKVNIDSSSADQSSPQMVIDSDNNIIIAWIDTRNGGHDLYMQKFNSSGTALLSSDIKINSSSAKISNIATFDMQLTPANQLFIGWTDTRNTNQDIYIKKMDTSGNTSVAEFIAHTSNTADQYGLDLGFNTITNKLYATWTDTRNGGQDIYMSVINSDGTRDITTPFEVDFSVPINTNGNQTASKIVVGADSNIYISWTDTRNGDEDIYVQKLSSAGLKLFPYDERLNKDPKGNTQNSSTISAQTDSTGVIAWADNRNSTFSIYITKIKDLTSSIRGSIAGSLTGSKILGTYPVSGMQTPIYKNSYTFSTNTSGTTSVNNVEWDSYTFKTNSPNTIQETIPTQAVTLNPNETKPITLYVSP